MAPAKPDTLELLKLAFEEQVKLLSAQDPDYLVLRSHVIAEVLLKLILAVRLDCDLKNLPRLNFYLVAHLALVGEGAAAHLQNEVLALNELRNDIAHDFSVTIPSRRWQFRDRAKSAPSERLRNRWLMIGLLRLVRLNVRLFADAIRRIMEKSSQAERDKLLAELPEHLHFFVTEPDLAWERSIANIKEFASRDPHLRPTSVDNVNSAQRAVLNVWKSYDLAMKSLAASNATGELSASEYDSIIAYATELKTGSLELLQITEEWKATDHATRFVARYEEVLRLLKQIEAVAASKEAKRPDSSP
jgi:hypothetical protein